LHIGIWADYLPAKLKKLGNNNLSPTEMMIGWSSQSKAHKLSIIVRCFVFIVNSLYLGGYHIPARYKN
jgi:hypothetical protein